MIHLNNIDKYYDSKFQWTFVLKAVNMEVKEGEFVSIKRSINSAIYKETRILLSPGF